MPKLLPEPSLIEFVVFSTVEIRPFPIDALAHNAMMLHGTPLPLKTWEAVVAGCISKGWLRRLDDIAFQEIKACLAGVEFVCDSEEVSQGGDIDFTQRGA